MEHPRRRHPRSGPGPFRIAVRVALAVLLVATVWVIHADTIRPPALPSPAPRDAAVGMYTNPLRFAPTTTDAFESCPDPAIIRGQQAGDAFWYLYCTTNPLSSTDRAADGKLDFHLLPILRSRDLIHWTHVGDVFSARAAWIIGWAGLWSPEIQFFNGKYYLYYATNGTLTPGRGSAIGVATALSPTGPWTDSGGPVVEPQPGPTGVRFGGRWVYDPAIATDSAGQRYLFYGSFVGGISARRLSDDGLHTDPATDVPIAVANRYEGVSVVRHDGYYYLFASAGDCCTGMLSSYSVLVGRSRNVLGPYTDREGVSLLAGQVGGTPVLEANGNRWIGPGHNRVFTDDAGQEWFLYHAVDRDDPYFAGSTLTKRPALLDPLDWPDSADGWPVVRGGLGASDTPQPAPVTQRGDARRPATAASFPADTPGFPDPALSVDFSTQPADVSGGNDAFPFGDWRWVRPPTKNIAEFTSGALRVATQAGNFDNHNASVLAEPTPTGDYTVETRLRLDVPTDGCCQNDVQAGLVIYGDDGNYVKLVHLSREDTRQIVFAKGLNPVPPRAAHAGNAVVGPAASQVSLRIVKRTDASGETYTAWSSRDGTHWVQGSTWTHALGSNARIGLVAMGGAGFHASFDYVHVYLLPPAH